MPEKYQIRRYRGWCGDGPNCFSVQTPGAGSMQYICDSFAEAIGTFDNLLDWHRARMIHSLDQVKQSAPA